MSSAGGDAARPRAHSARSAGRTIVIGIGNPYRHDDGLGPAVIALLEHHDLAPAHLATSAGEATDLIELWEGADLAIVIDAAVTELAAPGQIHRVELDWQSVPPAGAISSHGIEVTDAVELASALARLPDRLVLFTVEAGDLSYGVGLSPAVAEAVPSLVDEVRSELALQLATQGRPGSGAG